MEEQITIEDITLEKAFMCTFLETVEGKQRLRIAMNEGFELKEENGNFFVYKKNGEYPKTYEECCKVLGCKAVPVLVDGKPIVGIELIEGGECGYAFNLESN